MVWCCSDAGLWLLLLCNVVRYCLLLCLVFGFGTWLVFCVDKLVSVFCWCFGYLFSRFELYGSFGWFLLVFLW